MPYKDVEIGPLLESLGYQYVSGYGPQAIWQKPGQYQGEFDKFIQSAAANKEFGNLSPYQATNLKAEPDSKAPTGRYDAQGNYREWDPKGGLDQNGGWVINTEFTDPTKAAGYVAPRAPAAGPAPDTGPTRYQQATLDAAAQARTDNLAAAQTKFSEDIRQWGVEFAQKQVDRDYLVKKDAWAQQNSDKQLALQTQAQLASITAQQDTLRFNIQQAQQRSAELQQQRELDVAQFNSTGQFNVDKANADFADRRDARIQQTNTDIGVLGQDTGNRGKFAAFATAAAPWSGPSTTGANLIDSTSVQPLENSLQNRQNLMAQSSTPYTFNPLSLAPIANAVQGPLTAGNTANPNLGAQQTQAQQMADAINSGQAQPPGPVTTGPSSLPPQMPYGAGVWGAGSMSGATTAQLPKMEQGGMVRGAFMAGDSGDGEENPEVIVPLESGGSFVVSLKGLPPEKIRAAKAKLQKFATGGLFDFLGDSSPLSKQFLTDASAKFRQGTPWEGKTGNLPSAVWGSSPGVSPDLNALLASGRALEQGIPTSMSSWLTNLARPNTVGQSIIRRSA